jgi:periplasmic protein TonB
MSHSQLLLDCLVDSDLGSAQRARRRRRSAFVVSTAIELVVLAALLLLPLLMPEAIRRAYLVTPVPPYPGLPRQPSVEHPTAPRPPRTGAHPLLFAPPEIPQQTQAEGPEPAEEADADTDLPPGPSNAIFIPGAEGKGPAPLEPPKPAARKPAMVYRSANVQEAMLVRRIQPEYPQIARNAHISGQVILHAIIGKDGAIESLEVKSGQAILAHAAVEAIRQWRYRPTILNGEAVEVETTITVNFVLDD